MARYDWEALRQKFLLGNYKSLREFAEREGLNYKSSYFFKRTKGWIEEKEVREKEKRSKIIEGAIERQIKQEIDWNTKHLEAWGKFLNIILEAVEDYHRHFYSEKSSKLNPYALEKAANVLRMAQKGQRKALGLDEKQQEQANEIVERLQEIVRALSDGNVQPQAEDIHQTSEEQT